MSKIVSYFIKVNGRYLERGAWADNHLCTDDPEEAVDLDESGVQRFAKNIGLPLGGYTLVESRPILAAHRRALREKRAVARRVAESLATALRRRFNVDVYVGGKTKRDVRVRLVGLPVADFYVDMDAKIIANVGSQRTEGGIENAIHVLGKRLHQIRVAADCAV